jgi:hypothetical protein
MTRLRRDERGQITTAVVMVGIVMTAAIGVAVLKLGEATDEKSQVQNAADAAALAGARQIRDEASEMILGFIEGGRYVRPVCTMGSEAALEYAIRAGATLTGYCYYPELDTVEVDVQSSVPGGVSGAPAKATATARLGLALRDCSALPDKAQQTTATPTTATPTTATPTTTQTPPPGDRPFTVQCGDVKIPITLNGASNLPERLDVTVISELFTPALTS